MSGCFVSGLHHSAGACCAKEAAPRKLPEDETAAATASVASGLLLADLVQADLFYARDMTGTNHVFLGAIDTATNLHQMRLLADRSPETCLEAFGEMWIRPYKTLRGYQDGSLQGEMWEYLVRAGIEVEYVPAEAHYKLGKAERNNAIFRGA